MCQRCQNEFTVMGMFRGKEQFCSVRANSVEDALAAARRMRPLVAWQTADHSGQGILADMVEEFAQQEHMFDVGVSHAG